jgi:hypothetical protein
VEKETKLHKVRQCKIFPVWLRLRQRWYWLVFALLILTVVIYAVQRRDVQAFWDGSIGSLFATLLGIIAGVPTALEIERHRINREERERIAEGRKRALQVAFLIKDELMDNLQKLAERQNNVTQLPIKPLKNDIWRALSDSNEIRWIDDPRLLSSIASAYYYIGLVSSIEDKCYQACRGLDPVYPDGTRVSQYLLKDARGLDMEMMTSINSAIQLIKS